MKTKIVIYDSITGDRCTKNCTNEETGYQYFESATAKSSKCKGAYRIELQVEHPDFGWMVRDTRYLNELPNITTAA